MKKSKKKKLAKKSWKKLLGDKKTMKLIRNVMMMQDYSKRQVRKAFKASVNKFLDEEYTDEDQRFWADKMGYHKNDDAIEADEVLDEASPEVQDILKRFGKKK